MGGTTCVAQMDKAELLYKYQVGLELGPGDNSAPGTAFLFSGSFGGSFRVNNHVIGFRSSNFSDLHIFSSSYYYKLTGPYYGYAFRKKNVSIIPQATLGVFKSNYSQYSEYSGIGFEVSASANLHHRGLGIGLRPLINVNQVETYVGFVFHLVLGWEWNLKDKD
jgi:hypothetical protein